MEAKRISELKAVDNNIDGDSSYMPIDVQTNNNYILTKKINVKDLGKVIYEKVIASYVKQHINDLTSTFVSKLSDNFLDEFVKKYHTNADGNSSLALSTYEDLGVNALLKSALDSLQLNLYARKADLNSYFTCGTNEYIKSIRQENGKIVNVTKGKIADQVKVDDSLDSSSVNPISNSSVKAGLDTKINKDDANVTVAVEDNKYVAGFQQKDGIITSVIKKQLPTQVIDATLNATSTNPVQNKAIYNKLLDLESSLKSGLASVEGKQSNLNSSKAASSGQYITAITQKDGKIDNIKTNAFDSALNSTSVNAVQNKAIVQKFNNLQSDLNNLQSDLNNNLNSSLNSSKSAPTGQYITSITQKNGIITGITYGAPTVTVTQTTQTINTTSYKYSDANIIDVSGNLYGTNNNSGTTVFTANNDCIVNVTASIKMKYTSCNWKFPRHVWLIYSGQSTKNQLKEITNDDTPCNCTLLLKKGDKIMIDGGCKANHGTSYSITGTYLSRT